MAHLSRLDHLNIRSFKRGPHVCLGVPRDRAAQVVHQVRGKPKLGSVAGSRARAVVKGQPAHKDVADALLLQDLGQSGRAMCEVEESACSPHVSNDKLIDRLEADCQES